MSDTLLRAIARDAGIQICAASTTELVERAHEIHNTTPLATAALGRTLTATAIMGSQLKVEDGSVTVTCDDCGAVLSTETIPATGHDYKDGKCTVCGAADPDYRPEQPENPGQPEKPEKPEQPENPGVKTGDSGVLLYMGLMTVCALGACLTLRRRKAR